METASYTQEEKFSFHFARINFWSNMALDIAAFGEAQGIPHFVERMEMTCGAVPEGDYEQVIDPSAPQEFLDLYTGIAESRFAFAVTELLKLNSGYKAALQNYCLDRGRTMSGSIGSVKEAFSVVNMCVLDGMALDEKQVSFQSESKIVWKKNTSFHEKYWSKMGENVDTYFDLVSYFMQGVLYKSGIVLRADADGNWEIEA